MQLSHDPAVVDAVFDEANLVSCAGLAPVLALAEQAGLSELLAGQLTVRSPNAPVKVSALVAGMVAGARLLGVVVAGAVDGGHDGHWPPFATLALLPRAAEPMQSIDA